MQVTAVGPLAPELARMMAQAPQEAGAAGTGFPRSWYRELHDLRFANTGDCSGSSGDSGVDRSNNGRRNLVIVTAGVTTQVARVTEVKTAVLWPLVTTLMVVKVLVLGPGVMEAKLLVRRRQAGEAAMLFLLRY